MSALGRFEASLLALPFPGDPVEATVHDLQDRIHPAVVEALAVAGLAVTAGQLRTVVRMLADDLHRDLGLS